MLHLLVVSFILCGRRDMMSSFVKILVIGVVKLIIECIEEEV